MKKVLITLSAALMVSVFASCDAKMCYCYNYVSAGHIEESTEYTESDKACSILSSGYEGSIGSRVCVESYERMDPGSMASK